MFPIAAKGREGSPTRSKRSDPSSRDKGSTTKGELMVKASDELANCVIDFLNLLFGNGKDSTWFWEHVVGAQIEYDFDIEANGLNMRAVPLGGLLHAVLYHCGIDLKLAVDSFTKELLVQKQTEIDTLIKELGTVPKPFKRNMYLGLKLSCSTFDLRNLDIRMLSERYREFRSNKNYDLSIKACNIKQTIEKMLSYKKENPGDPVIFAELGEILLEMGEIEKAIEKASLGLKLCAPLHAERVKPYCVLIQGQARKNNMEKALEYFDEALKILDFHLGAYHPLHCTVYSVLSHFYAEKSLYQDTLFLHKSSLVCSIRTLGPNHSNTGDIYVDLAKLMLQMGQREEALSHFEKACLVYEASKGPDSADCAAMNVQMAKIHLEIGK